MKTLLKILIAVALPLLAYYTGVGLPVGARGWPMYANNISWFALGIYFVIYLPLRGIGNRPWVFRVLMAVLGIAVVASTWQATLDARSKFLEAQAQVR